MTKVIDIKKKQKKREVALRNLKEDTIIDLAATYFVDNSKKYGEAGESAIEEFKYLPAIQGEQGSNLISSGLFQSRQDGKRYTGNVSEYQIIQSCAKIMQESFMELKVQDVLELVGSELGVKADYKNKYIEDLAKSENKEDKKIFQSVLAHYIQYITDTKVSEALGERTNSIKSGLEGILCKNKRISTGVHEADGYELSEAA